MATKSTYQSPIARHVEMNLLGETDRDEFSINTDRRRRNWLIEVLLSWIRLLRVINDVICLNRSEQCIGPQVRQPYCGSQPRRETKRIRHQWKFNETRYEVRRKQ